MHPVAIVVVHYNGLADTLRCLESISRVSYPVLETIVVDNASIEDPTRAIADGFPLCQTLRLSENRGYAGGANAGIRHALARGAAYVLLLNNDTVVAELILARLVEAALRHPSFGVLGPVINSMDEPETVLTEGCFFEPASASGVFVHAPVDRSRHQELALVDIVNGCCMLVDRRVFEAIGLMDERFFLVDEESDFCLRAARAGFSCGILPQTLVWHAWHASFRRTGLELLTYYDIRNLHLLLQKHRSNESALETLWVYFTRVRYAYDTAVETGNAAAVDAVVAGFDDALHHRFGRRVARQSWESHPLAWLLEGSRLASRVRRGVSAAATTARQLA